MRPTQEEEELIRTAYKSRLGGIFQKPKGCEEKSKELPDEGFRQVRDLIEHKVKELLQSLPTDGGAA